MKLGLVVEYVEVREGMAMVFGPDGSFLGSVGVERWAELVEEEQERLAVAQALERLAAGQAEDANVTGDGMLVLVCGSRDWWRDDIVQTKLAQLPRGTTIMHGGARGADQMAGVIAARLGFDVREFKADWNPDRKRYDPQAGIKRNLVMLDEQPDLVIAFHLDDSPGTQHVITELVKRGIALDVVSA